MADDVVKISMYNVGFGDCFLLRFPGPDRQRTVLIDCGSIKQGSAGGTDAIVKQIIADVTEDGAARIDVVAMSHRHKDHVSGFANSAWRDVEVGEVWLPWIEDPSNERAREILQEMANFAVALEAEVSALGEIGGLSFAEQELLDHVIGNTLGLSNDKAMATLHRGFKVRDAVTVPRKFLSSEKGMETDALPGVTVHVLAPSEDEEVIRDMNPPSSESFLRAAGRFTTSYGADLLPFPAGPAPAGQPSEELKDFLRTVANQSALLGAVSLESAVNNTSLMLVFEIGDAVLLFPGDSQWGSWKFNLEDQQRSELLGRTTFYKVGHHGSHNATPSTFVKELLNKAGGPASEVWAAASVTPHGRFKEIPKLKLINELEARITEPKRVVRSDQAPSVRNAPQGLSVLRKNRKAVRLDFELPVG